MKVREIGNGPLVVKLAGIAGGTGLYREEMEAAARAGFRVAALDTGGDRRDDLAPGRLGWDFLAGEVLRGLDLLEAERALLWGTSFGSLVALATAARRPERVAGLLLVHPPDAWQVPPLHAALVRWSLGRRNPVLASRLLLVFGFNLLMSWEAIYPSTLVRIPKLLQASLEAATPSATVHDKLHLLLHTPPGVPPSNAGIPIAILAGAWDTVAPLSGARRMAMRIPGARLRVMIASGHSGAYSRPREYARVVTEELRALCGPA